MSFVVVRLGEGSRLSVVSLVVVRRGVMPFVVVRCCEGSRLYVVSLVVVRRGEGSNLLYPSSSSVAAKEADTGVSLVVVRRSEGNRYW